MTRAIRSQWALPECFGVSRRRQEADESKGLGTRGFVRVLRLLETFSLAQLTAAVESALAIDVTGSAYAAVTTAAVRAG